MKRITLLAISILLSIGTLFSQIPTLSGKLNDTENPLELAQLSIDVEVVGNVATTTFDMTFYNPNHRVLEGELSAALNEGQEIYRYALDVNGKLREGVIVEKVKARQTFEAVVRQNIDPGIISKTKGNFFKTTIYPIPAGGNKRVVIGLVETLSSLEDQYIYTLPATSSLSIKKFELAVKVFKGDQGSTKPVSTFESTPFDTQEDVHYLSFKRDNYEMTKPLTFSIPQFGKSDYAVYTEDRNGKTYFYLTAKSPQLQETPKGKVKKIALFWDQSHSAKSRNIEKELSLLEKYLTSIPGTKSVLVYPFTYKMGDPVEFKIGNNVDEISKYLKALPQDGATRVDNLIFPDKVDEILLFSDAVNTIGQDKIATSKIPVHCITSGTGANYNLLKMVSIQSDGVFINLKRQSLESAVSILNKTKEKFLGTNATGGVEEIYPKYPENVGKVVEVVGILTGETANITLEFGSQGKVSQTKTYQINKERKNAPISRVWASKRIEYLQWEYEKNKKEILSLGRQFNIVTKNASLLVLDRIEDYVAHEIFPPEELREEYEQLMKQKGPVYVTSLEIIQERNITTLKDINSWYSSERKPDNFNKPQPRDVQNAPPSDDPFSEVEEEVDLDIREDAVMEEVVYEQAKMEEAPVEVQFDAFGDASGDLWDAEGVETFEPTENKPGGEKGPSIKVLSWMPDAPYMEELINAEGKVEELYFKLKADNENRPAFYIEVADFFFQKGEKDMATRILSNVIELDLENPELLKLVAKRYLDEGLFDIALNIYQSVRDLRPEEPQSHRDLALAYEAAGEYQKALDLFVYVLDTEWERFEEIKPVDIVELNHLISKYGKQLNLKGVNEAYIQHMPLDIRIVLDWSSNDNDIDLWVVDPNGEKCYYSNANTALGGRISRDFTRGYGPEEFSLKEAIRGTYIVYVNYFSESRQRITGPVTVYCTLFTNYGKENEARERIAIQLVDGGNTQQVGQLEFE